MQHQFNTWDKLICLIYTVQCSFVFVLFFCFFLNGIYQGIQDQSLLVQFGTQFPSSCLFAYPPYPTKYDKYLSNIMLYMLSDILNPSMFKRLKASIAVFVFRQLVLLSFMAAIHAVVASRGGHGGANCKFPPPSEEKNDQNQPFCILPPRCPHTNF